MVLPTATIISWLEMVDTVRPPAQRLSPSVSLPVNPAIVQQQLTPCRQLTKS